MRHRGFRYCNEHKHWTPPGRLCPECDVKITARYDAALIPLWRDVIPLHRTLEFLKIEHIYCRDEEHAFYKYNGNNVTNKEKLRVLVLEKRQEFLQLFIRVLEDEKQSGEL